MALRITVRAMQRASHRPSTFVVATLVVMAVTLTGCAGAAKGKLLIADGSGASQDGVKIWAVSPDEPGNDQLDDDALVIASAAQPNSISTRTEDGMTWINGLGREWKGSALLSYGSAEESRLITALPGEDGDTLAAASALQSTVLRRGVYVQTPEGCELATSTTESERVGDGLCAISSDERWVVSWPTPTQGESGPLTIRDLRHDDTIEVDDLGGTVVNAVALGFDNRVFAVVENDEGMQGVVLDATTGEDVGRTPVHPFLDVATLGAESEGFVILTSDDDESTTLSYVDSEAEVTEIEAAGPGRLQLPISNDHGVVFITYSQEMESLAESTVSEWTPGDDEAEVLITGQVGAGTADGHLLILREVSAEENAAGGAPRPPHAGVDTEHSDDDHDEAPKGATVEFWRPGAGHELTKVLTLPVPDDATSIAEGGTGAVVRTAWVKGHTAYLQVDQGDVASLVRLDLTGDHSDAPVVNRAGLTLNSLDGDGTVLMTAPTEGAEPGTEEDVMVLRPHDHDPVVRTTFTQTALSLITAGRIYVTALTGEGEERSVDVFSLRATGKLHRELLFSDAQIAGATWPEQNGATTTSITSVGTLIEAQQAQQQQSSQQQQMQEQIQEQMEQLQQAPTEPAS